MLQAPFLRFQLRSSHINPPHLRHSYIHHMSFLAALPFGFLALTLSSLMASPFSVSNSCNKASTSWPPRRRRTRPARRDDPERSPASVNWSPL